MFRVNSLVGQVWVVQLRRKTQARYRHSGPASVPQGLQTGYAWRSFSVFFEPLNAIELVRLFENLLRFAKYEAPPLARSLFLSYAPVSFEHDLGGEYIGPGVWNPHTGAKKAVLRVRRTLKRWCDWLEALTHLQVHGERRQGGVNEVDKAIILLWPLLKHYRWNYSDLLALLRSSFGGKQIDSVLDSEDKLAEHCRKELGLAIARNSKTAARVPIAGHAVAERLMKFLPAFG